MEFKKGDKIVYLGTKEGRIDGDWEHYFGQYGIKKGSKGVIDHFTGEGIFIRDDRRDGTSGKLVKGDIVLAKNYKPRGLKIPTHLVIWDEKDRDPHQFFTDEPAAKEFMKELEEKDRVIKDSVILVAIKSVQKVSITKMVRLAGYKI